MLINHDKTFLSAALLTAPAELRLKMTNYFEKLAILCDATLLKLRYEVGKRNVKRADGVVFNKDQNIQGTRETLNDDDNKI